MNGLRLLLALAAFAGMVALCVLGWNYGGMGGLIGAGLGFLLRLGGRGLDWGERLGNAYVGALMGMPVGLLIGGLIAVGAPYLLTMINNAPQ
ncbi:MAG: hypothetical protein R3C30_00090 [Hyphomonadaceae bacterium]